MPYSKNCDSYKWNVEKSITADELISRHNIYKQYGTLRVSLNAIEFSTPTEKDNFTAFVYSDSGFRFISKIFTSINCDSNIELTNVFPKVDWTREWTVEEILADYGYTEKEIKEVMDDLANFKGMD